MARPRSGIASTQRQAMRRPAAIWAGVAMVLFFRSHADGGGRAGVSPSHPHHQFYPQGVQAR